MIKRSRNKRIAGVLALALALNMSASNVVFAKGLFGEYRQGEILAFGIDLTDEEESQLREYFGVSSDMEATYVTTEVAVEQLGLPKSAIHTYKGGWYSSAYVKLTKSGGVNVTTKNLTKVTKDMLANALITSGVTNCDVIAASPFNVTGESALAGILAGVEDIMGEKLTQENKETAQKEIETTIDLAEEIGDKKASSIINDIKAEVIKDSPINNVQIENIVVNVANNYNIQLSEESKEKVVRLMSDVNDLDIEYNDVKATLKQAGSKLKEELRDMGIEIQQSGVLKKIGNWFKDIYSNVCSWVKNIFSSDISDDELKYNASSVDKNTDDNLNEDTVDYNSNNDINNNVDEHTELSEDGVEDSFSFSDEREYIHDNEINENESNENEDDKSVEPEQLIELQENISNEIE